MPNPLGVVVVQQPIPGPIVIVEKKAAVLVATSGGPAGAKGLSGPGISSHPWVIQGPIVEEELMGFPVYVGEEEEQHFIGFTSVLNKGKVTIKVIHNGTELFPVVVEEGKHQSLLKVPLNLVDEDYININIVKSEEANGLSFATFIKHTSK